jgi:hypothetical protein
MSMSTAPNFQHFRVKLFATAASAPDLHKSIPVFHRWIREKRMPETAIDVSDYLHVPAGPGVILVCHEAIYGLDLEKNSLGLIYNRRTALDGSNEDRLRLAMQATSAAASWIESEPEFAGNLKFDRTRWEVVVNDRALAPNTPATFDALFPALQTVFGHAASLALASAPGELFRVKVAA